MKIRYLLLPLIIILTIPSIWYLYMAGFPATDDGNWMIIRFSAFYQAISDGQFPARFLHRLNFGYGYPVANFLYPGFMYLAVPFKVIGLTYVESIKVVMALSVVSSGLFAYLWLRRIFDDISAFFGALFYVYAPYHLYDLVKRGSVGELLSLSVLPFVLLQVERRSITWASLSLAFLIISHNTLAILFFGLVIAYMVISIYVLPKKERQALIKICKKIILFGLGLSAFFWVPAVLELSNTVFSQTKISNYTEYFADHNLIGITTLVIITVAISAFIFRIELIKKNVIVILMLVIAFVSVFFASPLSKPLWEFLPVSFVQFPFRVLSLTLIATALLTSFVLSLLPTKLRIAGGVVIIFVTLFLSKEYLLPKDFNSQDDSFYSTNEATTTVEDEYMPLWVRNKPKSHFLDKAEIIKGEGEVSNVLYNGKSIHFNYSSDSPSVVRINTIYYPGWKAYSNGKEKAVFFDNEQGVMDLRLADGDQKVILTFGETPARILSDAVSIISLIGLLIYTNKNNLLKLFKR